MTTETEKERTVNYTGNKVVYDHCPLTGLKCCCERHVCKARKYRRVPYDRMKVYSYPTTLGASDSPFDGQTIHKSSYIPYHTSKLDNFKPSHGISLKVGNFEKITTHSSSFPKWVGIQKTNPFQPCNRNLLGTGPLQDTTNQKDDYTFKPYSKRQPFKIRSSLFCPDRPFDAKSTSSVSYRPPENFVPTKNMRPTNFMSKDCTPISDKTIQRADYIAWKPAEKVDTSSWNGKKVFVEPKVPMENASMYKRSYQPSKPRSKNEDISSCEKLYKYNTITQDKSFYDTTIYADSYSAKKAQPERVGKKSTKTSIHFGNDKFNGQSTHSLTYNAPSNARRSVPKKYDCSNALKKSGPMNLVTTHKSDYTTKPYSRRPLETMAKFNTFQPLNVPLNTTTTTGLGFPPQKITKRPELVKPIPTICPSDEKFDGDTLYKKSYTPWLIPKREPYLASPDKLMGFKLTGPFYGTTTYRNTYLTPERLVEDECAKPCGCKFPTQCLDIK